MTGKAFKRPALRQRRRNLVRQLFSGWPWLIWMAAAIAVLVLLPGGMNRIRFYGVAERTYEYISPLESGRLKSLTVNLGDPVYRHGLMKWQTQCCAAPGKGRPSVLGFYS